MQLWLYHFDNRQYCKKNTIFFSNRQRAKLENWKELIQRWNQRRKPFCQIDTGFAHSIQHASIYTTVDSDVNLYAVFEKGLRINLRQNLKYIKEILI